MIEPFPPDAAVPRDLVLKTLSTFCVKVLMVRL